MKVEQRENWNDNSSSNKHNQRRRKPEGRKGSVYILQYMRGLK